MRDTILIVTSSFDRTCDYIISEYRDVKFFRFNLDRFSSYQVRVNSEGFEVCNLHQSISSLSCKSIYYRKPSFENLNGIYSSKYHQFSYRETQALVEGIVEWFPGRCLTKPSIMKKSGNKVFQALMAKSIGLQIPDLRITNDSENIISLAGGKCITKPLAVGTVSSNQKKEFVQTNIFDQSIDRSYLKYTPAYFQKYIDKDYEVRITFINGKYFPVRIDSENPIDWRKPGNKVKYSICSLPEEIVCACVKYLELSNMIFGCFDFIVKNDEWYFLEMNANGQWAWLEFELNLEISEEIVRYLNVG